jgi:hypothetical protein
MLLKNHQPQTNYTLIIELLHSFYFDFLTEQICNFILILFMIEFKLEYDFGHVFNNPSFHAKNCDILNVNMIMEIELKGIRIAAINGDKFPCNANDNPIIL